MKKITYTILNSKHQLIKMIKVCKEKTWRKRRLKTEMKPRMKHGWWHHYPDSFLGLWRYINHLFTY